MPHHIRTGKEGPQPPVKDAGSGPASQEGKATLGPFSAILGCLCLPSPQATPMTWDGGPGKEGVGRCSCSQGSGSSLTCQSGHPWGLRLQWLARLCAYLLGFGLWEELLALGTPWPDRLSGHILVKAVMVNPEAPPLILPSALEH